MLGVVFVEESGQLKQLRGYGLVISASEVYGFWFGVGNSRKAQEQL
jgi:hypothetical protein